ncbi:hypothetical protein ABID56_002104 [Alkalibacillus flavidus]|uniref:Uncharacterized protein n=1 Tax=Alkalibacillus flavidus TaxID=546021 RepID=A0ABV2KX71_9BACI
MHLRLLAALRSLLPRCKLQSSLLDDVAWLEPCPGKGNMAIAPEEPMLSLCHVEPSEVF